MARVRVLTVGHDSTLRPVLRGNDGGCFGFESCLWRGCIEAWVCSSQPTSNGPSDYRLPKVTPAPTVPWRGGRRLHCTQHRCHPTPTHGHHLLRAPAAGHLGLGPGDAAARARAAAARGDPQQQHPLPHAPVGGPGGRPAHPQAQLAAAKVGRCCGLCVAYCAGSWAYNGVRWPAVIPPLSRAHLPPEQARLRPVVRLGSW